jgi:hypothetical protein
MFLISGIQSNGKLGQGQAKKKTYFKHEEILEIS